MGSTPKEIIANIELGSGGVKGSKPNRFKIEVGISHAKCGYPLELMILIMIKDAGLLATKECLTKMSLKIY